MIVESHQAGANRRGARARGSDEGYGANTYGDRWADMYDAWVGGRISDAATQATVDGLADLADGGRVLELAIGTGRIALPLTERGVEVHGIDASEAMVAELRQKPGGDGLMRRPAPASGSRLHPARRPEDRPRGRSTRSSASGLPAGEPHRCDRRRPACCLQRIAVRAYCYNVQPGMAGGRFQVRNEDRYFRRSLPICWELCASHTPLHGRGRQW